MGISHIVLKCSYHFGYTTSNQCILRKSIRPFFLALEGEAVFQVRLLHCNSEQEKSDPPTCVIYSNSYVSLAFLVVLLSQLPSLGIGFVNPVLRLHTLPMVCVRGLSV